MTSYILGKRQGNNYISGEKLVLILVNKNLNTLKRLSAPIRMHSVNKSYDFKTEPLVVSV